MEFLLCPWESPAYFIFSSNVPPLLHYSHFIAIAVALLVGGYVFLKDRQSLTSQLLFILFSLFSFWAITDVFIWATNRTDIVIFWWSLQVLAEPLIYAIAFYLFYVFAHGKFPSGRTALTIGVLLLPLILLTPTHYNLEGIYLADCDAQEGPLALYYTYFLEILFSLGIVFYGIRNLFNLKNAIERAKIIYFTLGILAFLLAFTSGNIVGIIGTRYRPLENAFQLREALESLFVSIARATDPYSKGLIALAGLSYIQPFEDGNKRTARLVANAILMAEHAAPLSYRSVDEITYREATLVFYETHSIVPLKDLFTSQYLFAAEQYGIG